MKQKHTVEIPELGLIFNTGTMAKMASGSVTLTLGESVLFCAATAANKTRPGQDFFPLTVDYREKYSAAGRFPGGYFKREGRPSEKEILTSRLCDRPLRPLFPKGFLNEVQVIGMMLSIDGVNEPDILMINAASAAVAISDIPWDGPVAAIRLGEIDGKFVVNPTVQQQYESTLDLIYVGTETEMLMIEGSAEQMPDDRFVEALAFAQEAIQPIIKGIKELVRVAGKEKKEFPLHLPKPEVVEIVRREATDKLVEAVFHDNRSVREANVSAVIDETRATVEKELGEDGFEDHDIDMAFEELQEEVYRSNILEKGKRVDGRSPKDLRQLSSDVGLLPRVHGSALFSRGETQALVITTLGSTKDSQSLDALTGGTDSKSFILHYNFPPYSVGEAGRFIGPGRREIGHGALAERSLAGVIPSEDVFPYSIRVVSEVMESNGSTSMASICGGCLSLMDAGVPIVAPVAGISVGMVSGQKQEDGSFDKYVTLLDILGAEDHFGDMDFKLAGTPDGITGFQLDLKIGGLPFPVAKEAIAMASEARKKILANMLEAISEPRKEMNQYAPRIVTLQIDPDKIGALIGPGGKNIRRITETTGATVDIDDDNSGKVYVYSNNKQSMDAAVAEVEAISAEIVVGKIYRGIVRGIKDFGCFVEVLPGKEGLVHISELADFRVNKTEDVAKLGDELWVKCIGIDERGRVRLSRKAAMEEMAEKEDSEDSKD
ncbi:MAG: polyribonucleotide nucleotidyltransferase [Opitutales bacterium]|nr:polyribonucleotide nucleotidyltransferase [Opitutales bacterium]